MPKGIFPTAELFLPAKLSLPAMRSACQGCRGCDLYKHATQAVFGEGPVHAKVMFVGEQPGDQEDLTGKPFVGPAGKLLDKFLDKVGIDRGETYVTNAVKHFKFEPRGKKRIHAKPTARQVEACKPWLKAEVQLIQPSVIVALGATAAQAILGKDFRVTKHRGEPITDNTWAPCVIATVHPSSLLRAPDEAARREAFAAFEKDLRAVKREMQRLQRSGRRARQATTRAGAAHPGQVDTQPERVNGRAPQRSALGAR